MIDADTAGARRVPAQRGATAGAVLALLAGLGAAELVALLFSPAASPISVVGAVVIDLTPPWLKDAVIALAGTADKAVLIGCVLIGTLALTALIASMSRGRALFVTLWCVVVAAIAVITALTRGEPSPGTALPGVVLGIVACGSLHVLRSLSTHTEDETRRRGLIGAAAAMGVLGVGGLTGSAMLRGLRPTETMDPVVLPKPVRTPPELPASVDVEGISPLRTQQSDLYRIDTALVIPAQRRDWDLVIDGMVDAEIRLTLEQLLAEEMIEIDATMLCVSNPVGGDLVGSVRFQGVPVRTLLERARPQPGADQVLSTSQDGFTAGTPLEALTDPHRDALIVVGINGEPLTPEHGAPMRLFTPGLYGYVGATKWLRRLTVGTFADQKAYWTTRGWSERGPVKTSARIDTPRSGATVHPGADGTVPVAGVGWAVHRGVSAIQVRIDDGDWLDAEVGEDVNADYWRQWVLRAHLNPGTHRVQARAADDEGRWQSDDERPPAPDGAEGLHTVEFTVADG